MSDAKVHAATHPSGHANKTAVNESNPIFGRPADVIPTEPSIEQAAIVQSEKHHRETVVSPLINEEIAADSGATPLPENGGATELVIETKEYADGSSATGVAPLPDLSPDEQAGLPSSADLDAISADTEAAALTKSSGDDQDAGDWTKTEGAGLTDNTSPAKPKQD